MAITCFKYQSGASALRSLSEGTTYFASAQELNDSLELQFDLANSDAYVEVLDRTIAEVCAERGEERTPSRDTALIEALGRKIDSENERFAEACHRVGVFSASPRGDNQPMWAYYCNNSRGVCFELEWTDDILAEYQLVPARVEYSATTRVHNRAEDLRNLILLVAKENPQASADEVMSMTLSDSFRRRWGIMTTARAACVKHADWQHEDEIRILAPRAGPLPLMKAVLKSVIYIRTDFTEWGSIMMLLHRLYPDAARFTLKFDHREPFASFMPMTFKKVPISKDEDLWRGA